MSWRHKIPEQVLEVNFLKVQLRRRAVYDDCIPMKVVERGDVDLFPESKPNNIVAIEPNMKFVM